MAGTPAASAPGTSGAAVETPDPSVGLRREILIVLPGLLLAIMLAMLDQLIVGTALPRLVGSAIAIIGDLVSPRERGQYMGYIMGVMMLATIGGPLLGGFITDSFSWRWIFYINLPIGGAALAYLAVTLHLPKRRVQHRVDYLGAAILAVGTTALVLLSTWGGTEYAWRSPQ